MTMPTTLTLSDEAKCVSKPTIKRNKNTKSYCQCDEKSTFFPRVASRASPTSPEENR